MKYIILFINFHQLLPVVLFQISQMDYLQYEIKFMKIRGRRDVQTAWKWHLKVHVYSVVLCKHTGLWGRPLLSPSSCMTLSKSLLSSHFLLSITWLLCLIFNWLRAKIPQKISCTWSINIITVVYLLWCFLVLE